MTKDNNMLGEFQLDGIPPAPRGVPQIEVTYDIDANGILNVNAADKSTGKSNKIVITNEKGRLSQDDIDRMVSEADKYAEEDKKNKERIEAKNGVENYCFSLRTSLDDEQMKDKVSPEDKKTITDKADEILQWLDSNQSASTEEFQEKQKELEAIANPIMTKLYQGAGGEGMPDMGAAGGNDGPTVEEVD
eukprot:252081_1